MRAAIFRNGEIVVDQLPEPAPGPGDVLVRTLACGEGGLVYWVDRKCPQRPRALPRAPP